MRRIIAALTALLCFAIGFAASGLKRTNDADVLMVDGVPFVILGGELGNSSATCDADIERIFPKLARMNLNTVLVPAYWELTEPEEGRFDFSLTDKVLDEARRNGLHVVFLWFGAWKNSMSCYAPAWFKADTGRFPRARTKSGKPLEIASAFSPEVLNADRRAFTTWLRHVADTDTAGTMIMLQIENEIGMLEDARDHSALAEAEYAKGVPSGLMKHIASKQKQLHPSLLKKWTDNGRRKAGSWTEVFGDDRYTDELFMAWNYGRYVEALAREADKIMPGMPLYVNAAMNSRGRRPGEYPSAGPLAHLKDVWHAAAPHIDILAPDIYDAGFADWMAQYALPDNTLFVPEVKRGAENGAQAYYILGHHDAIGISPFSIENGSDDPASPMVQAYALLSELTPLVTRHAGTDAMDAVLLSADEPERVFTDGDTRITLSHYFTLPWDPRAKDGSEWPQTGAILIRLADGEYLLAGTGVVAKFEHVAEQNTNVRLGEDGFLNAGSDRRDDTSSATARIGLARVEEVAVAPDGTLSRVRTFNGDETHQGRHARISVDDHKILHINTYSYK